GLLAETYRQIGRPEEGATIAVEALGIAQQTGQRVQETWLSWLSGELLLQSKARTTPKHGKGSHDKSAVRSPQSAILSTQHPIPSTPAEAEAEAYFHKAIATAQSQGAKWLELRATMSLSRLWQQQGKKDEARQKLVAIYGWFTEGFDTAGLKEARALLDE